MRGLLLALAIATYPAPAAAWAGAPNDQAEPTERICLAVAIMWGGTAEDVRHIRDIPVPVSYRHLYEDDPCQNFGWPMETLVTWHLAYGDEASTRAALAYLEAHFTEHMPAPARLTSLLAGAVRAAGPALRAAEPGLAAGGSHYLEAHRALERHPSVRRLWDLTGAREHFLFLARQYLRAAEVFASPAFLARANAFYMPVRDSFAQVRAPDSEDRLGIAPDQNDGLDQLAMRLAVARARLAGGAADWQAAEAVLARVGTPAIILAGAHAYENGADFCDLESGAEVAPLRDACERDSGWVQRDAIAYWLSRAELDLLADPPGNRDPAAQPESFGNAKRLLERGSEGGFLGESSRDWRIRLSLARADQLARAARAAEARGSSAAGEAMELQRAALTVLAEAERLAPPPWAPAWFRRIAEAYLRIAADLDGARPADQEPQLFRPADPRMTAYFRHILGALDAIAVGDPPPAR